MLRGYIENLTVSPVPILTLAFSLPALATEIIYDEDVLGNENIAIWENSISELETLIIAGTIEIRDSSDDVLSPNDVKGWVYQKSTPPEALPTNVKVGTSLIQYRGVLSRKIPSTARFLSSGDAVLHSMTGVYIPTDAKVRSMSLTLDEPDSRTYELVLYSDPTGSPTLAVSNVALIIGARSISVSGLDIPLTQGEYGMAIRRLDGNSSASKFASAIAHMIVEVTF